MSDDKARDFSSTIRDDFGEASPEFLVWSTISAEFDLAQAEFITTGMICRSLGSLPRRQILEAMLYLSSQRVQAFSHVYALAAEHELVILAPEDVIQYLEARSTIGIIHPETGLPLTVDVPVVSFFRPTNECRKYFLKRGVREGEEGR